MRPLDENSYHGITTRPRIGPRTDIVPLDLQDGNRVHLADSLDCLFAFGERWRREATAGLRALGLNPPDGEP